MSSARSYHHSVLHYHAPFPLAHRNARTFPRRDGPVSVTPGTYLGAPIGVPTYAATAAGPVPPSIEREGASDDRHYVASNDRCVGYGVSNDDQQDDDDDDRQRGYGAYGAWGAYEAPPGSFFVPPNDDDDTLLSLRSGGNGDNNGGAHRTSPTNRAPGSPGRKRHFPNAATNVARDPLAPPPAGSAAASAVRRASPPRFGRGGGALEPPATAPAKKFSPLAHSEAPLSAAEARRAWLQSKSLRFGVHRRLGEFYVTPDEYPDPLRGTRVDRRVAAGFGERPIPAHQIKFHVAGEHRAPFALGCRRAPAHALQTPVKVNWYDPRHPEGAGAGRSEAASPSAPRLAATPLLEEVDTRLRFKGCGSLCDVRFASDDAIVGLLRSCGFGASDCMVALWELRKRFPIGASLGDAPSSASW